MRFVAPLTSIFFNLWPHETDPFSVDWSTIFTFFVKSPDLFGDLFGENLLAPKAPETTRFRRRYQLKFSWRFLREIGLSNLKFRTWALSRPLTFWTFRIPPFFSNVPIWFGENRGSTASFFRSDFLLKSNRPFLQQWPSSIRVNRGSMASLFSSDHKWFFVDL